MSRSIHAKAEQDIADAVGRKAEVAAITEAAFVRVSGLKVEN